jgi:DNA-binding NarL/FixJ family response regulator
MKPISRAARRRQDGDLLAGTAFVRPGHILLADRDALLRRRLTLALAADGHHVVEAHNQRVLLDLLATTLLGDEPAFQLVIFSVGLPGWSGLNLLHVLAESATPPKLLMLKGVGDDDLLTAAYQVKVSAVVERAADAHDVREAVRELLSDVTSAR